MFHPGSSVQDVRQQRQEISALSRLDHPGLVGLHDGTAAYLSPEQARGEQAGPPVDVYALGLVLLEAVTGHREYPGAAVESATARLHRRPVVPESLPGGLTP